MDPNQKLGSFFLYFCLKNIGFIFQFPQLLQEVKQFLSSIGSAKRVMSLLDNLKGGFHGNSATGSMLHEVHSWLDSARHFLNKMQMKYLLYRDLLVPFWAGLAQVNILSVIIDSACQLCFNVS